MLCCPINSVADPGCLSWIPDPEFYPSRFPGPESRIPDPFFCPTIFGSHKYHKIVKIVNNFIFEQVNKVFLGKTLIGSTFHPKICHKAIKKMDSGSGIRDTGSGKTQLRNSQLFKSAKQLRISLFIYLCGTC